jgi:hypothetical protein
MGAHNFFMVTPFASKIKEWVAKQQPPKKILRRRRKHLGNGSSEEDEDSIPDIHSLRTPISRKNEKNINHESSRRRMRERKKKCEKENLGQQTLSSSDDETGSPLPNGPEVIPDSRHKIIDQSPGAIKRLFRKQMPREMNEIDNYSYSYPLQRGALIPSRTFNKMKTQKNSKFMPDQWKTFKFDKKKIIDAMNS